MTQIVCRIRKPAIFAFLLLLLGARSQAQQSWDYLQALNSPNFSANVPVELGYINLANGNLHLEIPLADPPQRGSLKYRPRFVYDSRTWIPLWTGLNWMWVPLQATTSETYSNPSGHFPWDLMTDTVDLTTQATATTQYPTLWWNTRTVSCNGSNYTVFSNFEYTQGQITRYFDVQVSQNSCTNVPTSNQGYSADGAGYQLFVQADPSTGGVDYKILGPDGSDIWRDRNGNYIAQTAPGPFYDTVGNPVVTVSGTFAAGNQVYYDVLNSQGTTSRYTVNVTSISAATNFNQPGILDSTGTMVVVSSIILPDGTSYQFQYDSYGQLSSITLPSGGTISYGYTNFKDAFTNINRWVTSRTSAGGTWTYTPTVQNNVYCPTGASTGCTQLVQVTQPSSDYAVYTFPMHGAPWLYSIQRMSSTGTLLSSATRTYDFSQPCASCFGGIGYVHATVQVDSLPSVGGTTLSKQTTYAFDTPQQGHLTTLKEWGFYTGTPSTLPDRETDIFYQSSFIHLFASNGGPTFVLGGYISEPGTVNVYSAGTLVSETVYGVDQTTLVSKTGVNNHDDTDYGTGNTSRGNITQIQRRVSFTGNDAFLTTTLTYDTTGQLLTVSDPASHVVSYGYADVLSTGPDCGGGTRNAYLTSVTYPIAGSQSMAYFCGTGKLASVTDQNGGQRTFQYNDVLDRSTLVADAAGGWVLNAYTGATQVDTYTGITDTSRSVSCTACRHDDSVLDSLGRPSSTALPSDPDGGANTLTTYDTTGRAYLVANPNRGLNDPTYGLTYLFYDGLNRVVQSTLPNGNNETMAYGASVGSVSQSCSTGIGFPQLATDPAGKKRLSWIDGFGRVVEVDEPNSSGALTVATCYGYDALGNLLSVTQKGGTTDSSQWRTRSFAFDGLSRPTSATTPEGNTVSYFYTTAAGSLCAGDPNAVCRRTDGRGTTTTYTYDALSRLTGKTYSDTTPAVSYFYDQTSYNGLTPITYGLGRRTGMSDGSGQTAWSYDAVGRVVARRQTINGVTKTVSYTYNLDGSVAAITYPSGRTVTYQYNNARRATSAVDTANNKNYVTSAHYAAAGMMTSAIYGHVPGWDAISESDTYNLRLQLTSVLDTSPVPLTLLSLSYCYDQVSCSPDNSYLDNGDVMKITNAHYVTNPHDRDQTFSYDNLNRVATAQSTIWGDSFGYDAWGNLLSKTPIVGTAEGLTVSVNNKNQMIGYTYDAAGNITWDGSNAMRYDAENRAAPASGSTYTYDGDDKRVLKSDGTTYWMGEDRLPLEVTTSSGSRDYIYFNGERIAFVDLNNGNPYYFLSDHLGSASVVASGDGKAIMWEADYYPFGGRIQYTNNLTNYYQFTGYEFDYPTGYYNADFREMSPRFGRFLSPDPLMGDINDPQSWNRYAYVMDRPTLDTDPLGLDGEGGCGWCGNVPVIGSIVDFFGSIIGIFGPSGPTRLPGPPGGQTGAGQSSGPLAGETLGIPNGLSLPTPTLAGLILPTDARCEFGSCVTVVNPWTGEVGVSVGWTFPWGINVNLFAGVAVDLHGHIAVYHGGGGGAAVGARASGGVQLGGSNADTVCGLAGPFVNASGTLGAEGVAGTADIFHGKGNGPGGKVTGGGITLGVGSGGAASMGVTTTKVKPLGHFSCQ